MTKGSKRKMTVLVAACCFLLLAGNANAEIKVGMGNVLSGPFAAWGLDAKAGLEMAIEEINAQGGINGEKVVLLVRDDALDTTKAALQAEELIYKEKVVAFFPSTITGSAKVTVAVCDKAQTPAILGAQQSDITCPLTGVGSTPGQCSPWVFRMIGTVSQQADALVKIARDRLKGKKIALMHDNIGYGLEWREDLTKAAANNKVQFAASEMFPLMELDHTAALTRIKNSGADAIVVGTLGGPAGRIYNTMKKLGMTQPLLLCEAAVELAFRTTAADKGDGAYITSTQNSSSDTTDPKFAEFSRKWSAKYANQGYNDVLTTQICGFGYYDAMHLLAQVISQNGKDRSKIRQGIENTSSFKGISGATYSFGKDKHNGSSHLPWMLFRFQKGKILPVPD